VQWEFVDPDSDNPETSTPRHHFTATQLYYVNTFITCVIHLSGKVVVSYTRHKSVQIT